MLLTFIKTAYSQFTIPAPPLLDYVTNFPFYPTIGKYDFQGLTLSLNLADERKKLGLDMVNCSDITITNKEIGDFNIYTLKYYLDTLFSKSGIIIDPESQNTLYVRLYRCKAWVASGRKTTWSMPSGDEI